MNSTETSRIEELLKAILGVEAKLEPPQSRIEVLLWAILESGGGGGGGTTNYNLLTNLPQIGGVELKGNKTAAQLGLQSALTFDNVPTAGSNNPVKSGGVYAALANAIEHITVNGVEIIPTDQTVALTVLTNAVDSLLNYYKKSETYTKEEVDDLVDTIISLTLEIVETLPTEDISTTTIYLVPVSGSANVYMQYAYIGGAWAQLGTTEVDLTNYYTKTQVDALLADKQDLLTFDTAPTSGSTNPVTSGGIAAALAGKQDTLTFDTEPTENSTNPVTSGGVYEALSDIGVEVDFDEEDFDVDDTINMVSLLPKRRIFSGTTTEWNALTTAQKTFYGYAAFTDDEGETPIVAPEVGDITTSVTDVTGKYAKTGHTVQVTVYKHTSATLEDQTFTVRLPYKSAIPFYGPVYYITDVVGYCDISANSGNLHIHLDSGVTEFEVGLTYITTE